MLHAPVLADNVPHYPDPSDDGDLPRPSFTGERALLLAVLEDGINVLNKPVGKGARAKWSESYKWVLSDDMYWPFSFVNICYELGFDPSALRRRILDSIPLEVLERMRRGRTFQRHSQ